MKRPGASWQASALRRWSMFLSKAQVKIRKSKVKIIGLAFLVLPFAFSACRYDMQDQPRYKYYKQSDFFSDNRASRNLVEGTVPRGYLRDNKAFYTGKIDNPNPNAAVQTTTDQSGNTLV